MLRKCLLGLFVVAVVGSLFFLSKRSQSKPFLSTAESPVVQVTDTAVLASLYEDIAQTEYVASAVSGASDVYQAPNRANNLRTTFTAEGIQLVPRLVDSSNWSLGMALVGLGNNEQFVAVNTAVLETEGNTVLYQRGRLSEWYINTDQGLEQGFTVQSPLFSSDELFVDLALTTDLEARLSKDAQTVSFAQAAGAPVLEYSKLVVYDAAQRELPSSMALVALDDGRQAIRLQVDTAVATYPLTIDPTFRVPPSWQAFSNQNDDFGFAVSDAGDVNGDGYDDVLVGAPLYDGGAVDSGAVFAYYGTPGGLVPSYSFLVAYGLGRASFGASVGAAGDVNKDGYDDIIVGAPGDNGNRGSAHVFYGSPIGLTTANAWTVNSTQTSSQFGFAVNGAGDVDNNGYDDVIVGAPDYNTNGRAFVFYSGAGGINSANPWMVTGDASNFDPTIDLGYSVDTAGDVNGDTIDDVIIGDPRYASDGEPGLALVFLGSNQGLLTNTGFGSGLVFETLADWRVEGGAGFSGTPRFGHSVAGAGDVNGDGIDDMIVGAPGFDGQSTQEGFVAVYYGTDQGFAQFPSADWSITGTTGSQLGFSVDSAGDVFDDGADDVVVGAPGATGTNCTRGSVTGSAYIYDGFVSDGLDVLPQLETYECKLNTQYGRSVSTAGDVNRDGHADFVAGAPKFVAANNTSGQAYGYYGFGNITGLVASNNSPKQVNAPVLFEATIATGGNSTFTWDFGDNTTGNGPVTTHSYSSPGVYTATVTVVNDISGPVVAATQVTVNVGSLVTPQGGGSLQFTDGNNGIDLTLPPGSVDEPITVTYYPLDSSDFGPPASPRGQSPTGAAGPVPQPQNALGYFFALNAEAPESVYLPLVVKSGGNGRAATADGILSNDVVLGPPEANSVAGVSNCPAGHYCFLVPLELTVAYGNGLTPAEEASITLQYWDENLQQWVDVTTTCPGSTYQRDPANDQFKVLVCHFTRFGTVGVN